MTSASALKRSLTRLACVFLACWLAFPTWGQSIQLQVESRDIYAELPFTLSLSATGFDEDPQPEPPDLAIDGAEVTYLGVSPNVSSRISIINGRRSESRDVTFVYRWRVQVPNPGSYSVPALSLSQGGKQASSGAARFTAKGIETTTDMVVRMNLPQRPVWVGETFEVAVEWLLRRDVRDQNFVVPLFDLDGVSVSSTAEGRQRTLSFPAGAQNVDLVIEQDNVTENGQRYSRFRFPAEITVSKPGPLELDPLVVAASLETGTQRDRFGFRSSKYDIFRAQDVPRRLVVRPLPQQGRPASFENAIGTSFSIEVQASSTVVQVGDPIELRIKVRGDGPMEGLSLPSLTGTDGLPEALFGVLDTTVVGTIDAAENSKTFEVTARVKSADAREIPPISFSYFDPQTGTYGTAQSRPIALSVQGTNLIDASDITSAVAPTANEVSTSTSPAVASSVATLIGADMSLSAAGAYANSPLTRDDTRLWIILLYVLPMLVLLSRIWLARTAGSRGRSRELKHAVQTLEAALASGKPAREAAPDMVNAVRALAKLTGHSVAEVPALVELETSAFDPSLAEQPVSDTLVSEVRRAVQSWTAAGRSESVSAATTAALLFLALSLQGESGLASTDAESEAARASYQAALAEDDRVSRTRLFSEAEQQLRRLAAQEDISPELLADWGNAALGAQDLGYAVLAYRRALQLDPTHERSLKNLGWIRDRAPTWLPRPEASSALDSLFFWHNQMSVTQRLLIGAVAFGLGMLLLAPWPFRYAPVLRRVAIPVLLLWVAATGSALLADDGSKAAVVVGDSTLLRSADSLGAPATLANPLPAGTELNVLEARDAWVKVALFDGTQGWVASGALERVVAAD